MIPFPTNTYNFDAASRLALPNLKKQTNKIVSQIFMEKYNKQAEETSIQGEFFTLLSEEKLDISWKSYIYAVPR